MSRAPRSPNRERDYVLVVDSDQASLSATLAALSARGYPAAQARSVDEIREVAVSRGRPLVAIIEPAAEGIDGFRLCRSMVTAYGKERPLLLLASNRLHGRVAESRARDSGAFLFVERPARDRTLFDAVAHAFARARVELRSPDGDPRPGGPVPRASGTRDRCGVTDSGRATAGGGAEDPSPVAVEIPDRTAREIDLTEASAEEFESWLDGAFASFGDSQPEAAQAWTSDEVPRGLGVAVATKPAAVAATPVIEQREREARQASLTEEGGGEGLSVGAAAPESGATPPGSTGTSQKAAGRAAAAARAELSQPRAVKRRGRILSISAVASLLVVAGVTVGTVLLWPSSPGAEEGFETAGPTVPLGKETSSAQAAERQDAPASQKLRKIVPQETADAVAGSAPPQRGVREDISAVRQPFEAPDSLSGGSATTSALESPTAAKSGHTRAAIREVETGRQLPGEGAPATALDPSSPTSVADAVSGAAQPAAGGSEGPPHAPPNAGEAASTEDREIAAEKDSREARVPARAAGGRRDELTLAATSATTDPAAAKPSGVPMTATASPDEFGPAKAATESTQKAPIEGTAAAEPTAAPTGVSGSGLVAEVTSAGSRDSSNVEPVVAPPELIRSTRVEPAYPLAARQLRASGEVTLSVLVGTDGTVDRIEVLEEPSSALGFGAAAKRAVSQWRFRPGLRDGRPVPQTTTVKFFFNP